jgi:hypothetical protein
MTTVTEQVVVEGMPSHVGSWSAARIPGFIPAVLDRWRRQDGDLPARFVMVVCPQVEIDAMGGLPDRVRELTSPRLRFLHFTGCHKPFIVMLNIDGDSGAWCGKVQRLLPWSESFHVETAAGVTRLQFIEAIEECAVDRT